MIEPRRRSTDPHRRAETVIEVRDEKTLHWVLRCRVLEKVGNDPGTMAAALATAGWLTSFSVEGK